MPENLQQNTKSYFFAYAAQPPLVAETMREAVRAAASRGLEVHAWENLQVSGKVLIDPILEAIDSVDGCVAEIGSSNPNVLFEAGYALARGKELLLAIDETDQDATKAWSGLALIDTIGRVNYGGNAQILASELAGLVSGPAGHLIGSLLVGTTPREPNAVFVPNALHKVNAAERLQKLLERKTHLKLLAFQEELGIAPLRYYVGEIYKSSAAILHFMKPSRTRAVVYNAQLAFLGGIVRGFDLPLLMVAESGYKPPLDYKDLMYVYESAAKLTSHVDTWLSNLPTPRGSNRRLGQLNLDIELPIRSFGQYVAEDERALLSNYFVQTNEFEAVLAGRASVYVGRKGTGKSATMLQSVTELRTDRRNLVVSVKPSSYDLAGLMTMIEGLSDDSKRDYLLISLWSYLLVSEIAIRALKHANDLPAGLGGDQNVVELAEVMDSVGIDVESDLSTRLDEVISMASSDRGTQIVALSDIADVLRVKWRNQLLPPLRRVLQNYNRVAVLIDNLDKTWEKGVDFESLSHFILALLVTTGKLRSEFERSRNQQPSTDLTLTVFLRTDIYDVITKFAREPDKINPQSIRWDDEELLIRVLEDRYVAARRDLKEYDPAPLWTEIFCAETHGLPTRDYLLWRALPRPRDIIFLGNAALTTAINRRHSQVLSQDFSHAEDVYSRFAVDALLVESEAQGFDLEDILLEFAGFDSTISAGELEEVLSSAGAPTAVRDWLIRTSFLGLETREQGFVYVEGEAEARKKLKAAKRVAEKLKRPLRFRIHPAFRPYLEVRDDDLHSNY